MREGRLLRSCLDFVRGVLKRLQGIDRLAALPTVACVGGVPAPFKPDPVTPLRGGFKQVHPPQRVLLEG